MVNFPGYSMQVNILFLLIIALLSSINTCIFLLFHLHIALLSSTNTCIFLLFNLPIELFSSTSLYIFLLFHLPIVLLSSTSPGFFLIFHLPIETLLSTSPFLCQNLLINLENLIIILAKFLHWTTTIAQLKYQNFLFRSNFLSKQWKMIFLLYRLDFLLTNRTYNNTSNIEEIYFRS